MATTSDAGQPGGDRTAWYFLLAHGAFVCFGTAAFVTILAGTFPTLMQSPYTAKVYELSFKIAGPSTVYLGALAAIAHSWPRLGRNRALAMFVLASGVALASELGGTNIGFPFGPYHYTDMLGYKILGDVPVPIPVSWYYMLYGCMAICARLLPAADSQGGKWTWAIIAGFLLTFWDIPQDPAMTAVQPHHWEWDFAQFPAWVPEFAKTGFFYGMPLTNWIGWVVTGILIARLMLALMPPTVVRDKVAGSSLPIVLYAIGGVMPMAICIRHGMWLAVIPGAILMYGPVMLALRAGRPRAHSPVRAAAGDFSGVTLRTAE
jgi:putative membrane protein